MALIDTASGLVGACACTYTGLPFDVAKVRLQSGHYEYRGLVHCLYTVCKHEGPLAWWRGAVPALSSSIAENTTGLTVQRAIRRQLSPSGQSADVRLSAPTEIAVGAATGLCTCVVMNPFEVVKTRLQVARVRDATPAAADSPGVSPAGAGEGHSAVGGGGGAGTARGGGSPGAAAVRVQRLTVVGEVLQVTRHEGGRGLFRGLAALWARDIPFNALFFGSYETLTTVLMRTLGARDRDDLPGVAVCGAGGTAGVIGWTFVLPFDTVKTRMQASAGQAGPNGSRPAGLGAVLAGVLKAEGVRGLYRGWAAAVTRAFPANAAMFLGVETTQRVLKRRLGTPADRDVRRSDDPRR